MLTLTFTHSLKSGVSGSCSGAEGNGATESALGGRVRLSPRSPGCEPIGAAIDGSGARAV